MSEVIYCPNCGTEITNNNNIEPENAEKKPLTITIDLVDKSKQVKNIISGMIDSLCEEIFHSFDDLFDYINTLSYEYERVVVFYKYNTYYKGSPLKEIPFEERSIELTFKLKDYSKNIKLFFDKNSVISYKEIQEALDTQEDEEPVENEPIQVLDKNKTFIKLTK